MEINTFAQKVCAAMKNELGEGCDAEVREVVKNNGTRLHGLLIKDSRRNVIPTIYLESFWEAYESGVPFAMIIRKLMELYKEDTPKQKIEMEFFKYFERVKDRICFRLINVQGNEELLQEIPYVKFLDLAICFFYAYNGAELGEGSILIYNSHLDMWHTNVEELYSLARDNTPRLYPWDSADMVAVLEETLGFAVDEEARQQVHNARMMVLSNNKKIHGAACIIYPGLLEQLLGDKGKGFYILPSSIHEVILLRDTGGENPLTLKEMIEEVNASMVASEEILSDSLYYYDARDKKMRVIF